MSPLIYCFTWRRSLGYNLNNFFRNFGHNYFYFRDKYSLFLLPGTPSRRIFAKKSTFYGSSRSRPSPQSSCKHLSAPTGRGACRLVLPSDHRSYSRYPYPWCAAPRRYC